MERRNEGRRLGIAAAITLSTVMTGNTVAAESNDNYADQIPTLPITTSVFSPECNPFYNINLSLNTNPIIPTDHLAEINQVKSGETSYKDLPYGLYKYISEKPQEAGIIFDIDSGELDALPTPEEILVETLGEKYCPAPNEDNSDSEIYVETDTTSSSKDDILNLEDSKSQENNTEAQLEPKDLKLLFNKKANLPEGNLEEIRTELFEYLAKNPEVDQKVRAIDPKFDPELFFEYCISGKSDTKLTGCANTLILLMQVHKISNGEEVYDMTAEFMGATRYDMGSAFKSIYDYEMKNQKKHPELYE